MNLSFSTDRPSAQLTSMGSVSKRLNEISADSIPACSAARAKRPLLSKSSLEAGDDRERLFDSKARGLFVGERSVNFTLDGSGGHRVPAVAPHGVDQSQGAGHGPEA